MVYLLDYVSIEGEAVEAENPPPKQTTFSNRILYNNAFLNAMLASIVRQKPSIVDFFPAKKEGKASKITFLKD
jgi:hypothetical protein